MRNITVSVPDHIYRTARISAAEQDSSVSALVGEYLASLTDQGAEFSRLEDQQKKVQGQIKNFSAHSRLDRDEIHSRALR